MSVYGDRAETLSWEGFACSQCVVGAICENLGIDRLTALRFAAAFGSGIGGSAESCGAVTGAMMLIGLKYGRSLPEDPDDKCFEIAARFFERFKEEYDGCTKCKELLGADYSTEEGKKFIAENELWNTKCKQIVRKGAEIIAELLELPGSGESVGN